MICAWCEGVWDEEFSESIILHYKAPFKDSMDDEIYNLCSTKCLKRWLSL
jgi:hypothetical protein